MNQKYANVLKKDEAIAYMDSIAEAKKVPALATV
jgi:hypothetical protein